MTIVVGDLLAEFTELRPSGAEPIVLTLTEKNGFVSQAERFKKRLATEDTGKYKVVRRFDFAFNPYLLWAGAIAQNLVVDAGIISPLYPTFRAREGFDPRYVARLLLTPQMIAAYDSIAFGSVPRRRRSSVNDFLSLPLPDQPPLAEQRRIAAILDQTDTLRAKRRQTLDHLDELRQSIFHDMLDDQPSGVHALGEVVDFFGGASLPAGETYANQPDGTLLMKVSDMNSVGNEEAIFKTSRWTDGSTARSATVGEGAVVLPKRGASIATNKKRLTTRRTTLDPNLMGVMPKPGVLTSRYLFEWFKSFDLATITSGSTVPQLNKRDLSPLSIPVPTLARQAELGQRLSVVDARLAVVDRSSMALDALFDSLQGGAFSGRL